MLKTIVLLNFFVETVIYFKIQGFICHMQNYTEYNQQWIVSQVCSMDSAIICNTTQANIHKYRYKKFK